MKKVFLALILSVSSSFAYTWSGETVDGINIAFQQYDMFIQQQNEKLKQKYISKKTLYKDILQNQKDKELHLRHITILNIDNSLDKGDINFNYEKFKRLKDKQGDE